MQASVCSAVGAWLSPQGRIWGVQGERRPGLTERWGGTGPVKKWSKQGVVTQTWNPSTLEVEAGGSRVQSHPQLHSDLEASLEHMRLEVQQLSPNKSIPSRRERR